MFSKQVPTDRSASAYPQTIRLSVADELSMALAELKDAPAEHMRYFCHVRQERTLANSLLQSRVLYCATVTQST